MDFYEKRDWCPDLEGLKVSIDESNSKIRELYKGANIFITGGAGFLGSLLIEKIARSCPDFGKIYLLMRPKRGMTPSDRLNKVFEDEIFGTLKKVNPGFISKVMVIEGDLAWPMCGLNKEDQTTLENEVNFVFHIAACLRMSEPLKSAYNINIRATKDLLELGTRMKHLKGFVFVSTAYSHCFRPDISEKFYETEFTCDQLRDFVEVVPEEQLDYLTPKILGPWVNTYAFTKAVTEYLVKEYVERLPIAIARPSIVIGCVDEPLKNWINNVYGVTGVSAGACLGIIRVWNGDRNRVADIIPADYVINTMIAITWQLARQHHQTGHVEEPIYNIVSSPKSPTTWGEYVDLNARYAWECRLSFMEAVGEYWLAVVKQKWLYFLMVYILHLGQGLILDTVLILKGEKPKLLKGYIKIMRFNQQLAFFGNREWIYEQENVNKLLNEMGNEDKQLFPFDMNNFNWRAYHLCTIKAVLKYIVKSNDVELQAKAKLRSQK